MIYGYIRVSTDKQDLANQKFEITNFAAANGFAINGWIDETISGAKDYKKRARSSAGLFVVSRGRAHACMKRQSAAQSGSKADRRVGT